MSAAAGRLDETRAELMARARRDMAGEGVDPEACRYQYTLWRAAQDSVSETPLDADAPAEGARLTLKAVYELPTAALVADSGSAGTPAPAQGAIKLNLGDGESDVTVHLDTDLKPGHTAPGPCLLKGDYLTCLIGKGWHLRVSSNHDLVLEATQA